MLYSDRAAVEKVVARLRVLPPLVTSWEIEKLKGCIAERCAARSLCCRGRLRRAGRGMQPEAILAKLKILCRCRWC